MFKLATLSCNVCLNVTFLTLKKSFYSKMTLSTVYKIIMMIFRKAWLWTSSLDALLLWKNKFTSIGS